MSAQLADTVELFQAGNTAAADRPGPAVLKRALRAAMLASRLCDGQSPASAPEEAFFRMAADSAKLSGP